MTGVPVPSQLLTPVAVAGLLAISKRSVYRLVDTGRLTAVRFGPRMLRFDPAEVERLIRESSRGLRLGRRARSLRRPSPIGEGGGLPPVGIPGQTLT